jgi:hypothetical protein
MKTNIKKTLKLVTLLLSTLLIGTASATVYHHLYLSTSIGVAALKLAWDDTGLDTGVSANIQEAYCYISGLEAPRGGSATYNKAIGIKAIASTTFDIEVVDVTGNTTDLDYILIEIYNGTNGKQGEFYVWQNSQKGTGYTDLSITQDEIWRLQWTIAWKISVETSDTVEVSLKVTTPSP